MNYIFLEFSISPFLASIQKRDPMRVLRSSRLRQLPSRKGAATVELALVLPILLIILFAGVDFARAYYYTQLVTEAAQKGADYASNADLADQLPYVSLNEAAFADMTNVRPAPTVEVTTDWALPTPNVTVTVAYDFQPVCSKFGLGDSFTIRRSACHRMHPSLDLPAGGDP